MELNLKGKKALITGGTHGIGKAIALALVKEECYVAICAREINRLNDMLQYELPQHEDRAIGMQADITLKSDRLYLFRNIMQKWSKLDILINNVGGGGRWGNIEPTENEWTLWYDVWLKNTGVTAALTMEFIPGMIEQKWGRVITIASIYGKEAGGRPWFTSAKSASIALMKELSRWQPYARANITFNSICPGYIYIPGTGWDDDLKKNPNLAENLVAGKFGTPEDVANLVVFLCSEKAKYINGAVITVDGGESRSF